MTDAQAASYNMFQACKVFLAQHAADYATLVPMVAGATRFNGIVAKLETAASKQSADLAGYADDKEQDKEGLAKKMDGLAAALGALAESTGNNKLEQKVNVTEAMLIKMNVPEFTAKVLFLLDEAVNAGDDLEDYNYDSTAITALQAEFQTWRAGQGDVDHASAERETATKDIASLIKEGNNVLTDTLDRLVRVWAATNDSLKNEWAAVRALTDPDTETRALTVSVTAIINGAPQPVGAAAAVIEPGGTEKLTGEEGMFYVQALAPGAYKLHLSKPGFKAFTPLDFVVTDGEMTTVNAVMEVESGGANGE